MDERDYIALNKDLNKMKLKDSTFAIIAEKKDSISHKWMQENCKKDKIDWYYLGEYYTYGKGKHTLCSANKPDSIPIYTESEFEALLKAEQENELEPIIGNSRATGKNAQTFPKNTVFGRENIAHKHPSFEPKGDGNITLDKNEPLAANKKEISQGNIKRAQYYLECFTKKIMPNYESTGDYSDLKDKGKVEMLVNDVYNVMVKNKDVKEYPMREIVEKFKVSEIKFPKTVLHPNGFVKPFKGVAITKSEAEKILRDKFKLPDYVEFKIVE